MFGIGMPELAVILVVALIVLGPRRLPEVARQLGKAMAEFRRQSNDIMEELQSAARSEEDEARRRERERARAKLATAKTTPPDATASAPAPPTPAAAPSAPKPGTPTTGTV